MTVARGYVQGHYALELEHLNAGWLYSMDGGNPSSNVVTEALGPEHMTKKHVAGVQYDPITLQFGTGMSKSCYQWIKDSFDHKVSRRDGAIVGADFNHKEVSRLTFSNALISELSLPALDANAKDPARMTMKIDPEYTRMKMGGGKSIAGAFPNRSDVQKPWLPSNFRLNIDGMETRRVSKIDTLTLKQKTVEVPSGRTRDFEREPAKLEIPNLVITIPEANAQKFYEWHEDFVIHGKSMESLEKQGSLEFLATNVQEVLFTVTFVNLGIFKLTADKLDSHAENIRGVKVEMYCEHMTFDYKKAWA